MSLLRTFAAAATATTISITAVMAQQADGSASNPYRVMLVPADGGTEDGTRADFKPVFDAVTQTTGVHFDIKVGQTYATVIEAICSDVVEIAWFGAASYLPAKERGCAELLAVDVNKGASVYYSGIYASKDSGIASVADLKGHEMAFGDANSTSSFVYPVAMIVAAGLDPATDLSVIRMTGSHANSLKALAEGQVDAAAASFDSFEKAINAGTISATDFVVIGKSDPIPNPPLAMSTKLPADVKTRLRDAFNTVHEAPGITPEMIRGYGGKQVDRYDATVTDTMMAPALVTLSKVSGDLRTAIIAKASN
ncbi:phosphate/phosphite/phosphonate ABC transporter substrate-binding protein [Yoonia sp.]|uniref:phosphate/phosphite/phosphonate ABC transporter substrate-binding protein n=1 Tax=Yoonia sp. TaxID=2212373 RepID=UPI0019E94E47|nr:phosphate/phosphite/phosphonate ABC transporter substrate-binding protein [Yoonia sp.]MBE0413706.1 phosphate/phosphite/phosphonate ABC transporter substrate-binding protein [Yoonia sp.]